jgi:SAM-dependent methyltransferase
MNKEDQIKFQLAKTVGGSHYNGWHNRTTYGYHSYNIDEIQIVGQRTPKLRLESFKKHVDFNGKKVIDFGCNVGAMLHHLTEIEAGFGLDYDLNCIMAAREIAKTLELQNLQFHVHDFDRMDYRLLKQKIYFKPDVVFLLSLGSWVKSWNKLYEMTHSFNSQIILEINNEIEGKSQLDFFKQLGREPKLIVENSLDDTTGNNLRRTYLL